MRCVSKKTQAAHVYHLHHLIDVKISEAAKRQNQAGDGQAKKVKLG